MCYMKWNIKLSCKRPIQLKVSNYNLYYIRKATSELVSISNLHHCYNSITFQSAQYWHDSLSLYIDRNVNTFADTGDDSSNWSNVSWIRSYSNIALLLSDVSLCKYLWLGQIITDEIIQRFYLLLILLPTRISSV